MNHHLAPAVNADASPTGQAQASRWLALALLCLAQFMLILDVTVINVALPQLSTEIGLAARDAGWAITAYAVPFAGLMLLGGRSADLFGARRTFLAGLVVFTLGSLWAGLATDAVSLLAARVVQGMAAAFLSPSALAMVTHLFSGHDRHRALAVWGAIGGTGAAVGVLLGGLLTAGPGWRWIFFINVPVGVLVALGLPFLVPAIRGIGDGKLDLMGALLATLATASLVYGVAASGSGSPLWMWALAAAVALYAVFVLVEMSSPRPLVDLRLLGRRPVQAGAMLMLVGTGLLVGAFFLLSFLLQGRLGWSALDTGLGFLPVALTTIVGAHLAGHAIGLVGAVDAGEVLDLAGGAGLLEALRVALLGRPRAACRRRPRRTRRRHQVARHPPLGAEGRDEGDEHDQAGIGDQLRHLGDAADVLDAVGVGEAEVAVEAVADIVAVEDVGVAAHRVQLLLDEVGDGRLARARQAGEPEHRGFWPFSAARALVDVERLPVDVGARRSAKSIMPAPTVLVGEAVDQDEGAGRAVVRIGSKAIGWSSARLQTPISFSSSVLARVCLQRVDVDRCLSAVTVAATVRVPISGGRSGRAAAAPRHPEELAANWSETSGGASAAREHVAARDVDLVGERERHRLAGDGLGQVAVHGDDARDRRGFACPTCDDDLVAGRDRPEAIVPEKPRKSRFGRFTHCTGKRNGLLPRGRARPRRFRDARSASGRVPGRLARALGHVVAVARRDRDRRDRLEAEAGLRRRRVVGDDRSKDVSSKPTRSILLTASTTWRMPSSER
jgi:MFS family permease